MKKSIFVLGVAALAVAMVSCNKDEIKKIDNPTFDGDKAYIVVNINEVPGPSTRGTDGGFEYGSATEYAVNSAYFYFYGSDGDFVTEASVWDGGTAVADDPAGSVEFNGYTVITLSGLTSKTYPNWVVTVLNPSANFVAPSTLAEFEGLLADPTTTGIMSGDYYTMATSSYVSESDYYFATPVTEDNFSLDPVQGSNGSYTDGNGDEVDPIVIYVERLAAKVTLGWADGVQTTDGLYPITVEEEVEGVATSTTLYVQINGWTLNGTAKYSNAVKTIDTTWNFDWSWDDSSTNYRTYWGESFNYGLGIGSYPTSATDGAYDNDGYYDGTSYSDYLDYVSYDDCSSETDAYVYCAENTNTCATDTEAGVITMKESSAITNVLVAATVCDEEGNALDLVRCDGVLYTVEDFLALAASHIHLYTYEEVNDEDVYTSITADYLETYNKYDGYVGVQIASTYAETTFYEASGDTFVTVDDTAAYCDEHFNSSYGADANAYTGGAMYYSIPIEHLNNAEGVTSDEDGHVYPVEGNYGIVRNHIYALSITAVENLGRGVYDPDEIIIPQPEVETYSISAQINILSWKVVEQGVVF
ncbi:MAG: Mfa1 family fimbria major subunit [Bacteroidales bacterium]|nr:Mfa1 family fimbria major subunit [Bacteroidales bacterium]